ncbi:MAG: hypothetical protein ACOH1R_11050 [Luteimonas sp.]
MSFYKPMLVETGSRRREYPAKAGFHGGLRADIGERRFIECAGETVMDESCAGQCRDASWL